MTANAVSAGTAVPLSRRVARLALGRARVAVPESVARKSRLHLADTVGIALAAGRAGALPEQVVRAAAYGTRGGDCALLGRGERVPPAAAAFCNAALAHLLDFDDIHDVARLHPTAVTLPAALASAQLVAGGGARVAKAVTLGNELMCRLGVMCAPTGRGPGSDWFLTQLFGYFGSALAASIVLALSEDEVVSALGLAYMQAAGGKEAAFGAGSTARGIYPAFAARGGIEAALLARAGLRGPESALDGRAGLFRAYLGGEPTAAAIAALLDDSAWHVGEIEIKRWPCCRLSHPYVAAALAVRRELRQARVERIVASVNDSAAKLCQPLDQRRRPQTLQDAKYSIPFMIAFALARGEPTLGTLDEGAMRDPEVLELAARVVVDESLPDCPGQPPAEISVLTPTGTHLGSGLVAQPVSETMAREKFLGCLGHAGRHAEAPSLWDRLLDPDGDVCAALWGAHARAASAGARIDA